VVASWVEGAFSFVRSLAFQLLASIEAWVVVPSVVDLPLVAWDIVQDVSEDPFSLGLC